jgi:hypothetical protein
MKKSPCKMPLSVTRGLHDVDGKFGAEHGAQPASDAAPRVANLGGVIAFGIEEVRHFQDTARTVGYAQLAALAAFDDEMDFALWYHNAVLIERFTPKFHGYLLLGVCLQELSRQYHSA